MKIENTIDPRKKLKNFIVSETEMKELDMANYKETLVDSPKIPLEVGNLITNITLQEAFEVGKDAGLKEALTEIKNFTDSEFTKKFCETRLSTLEDNVNFLNKIKRGLK